VEELHSLAHTDQAAAAADRDAADLSGAVVYHLELDAHGIDSEPDPRCRARPCVLEDVVRASWMIR